MNSMIMVGRKRDMDRATNLTEFLKLLNDSEQRYETLRIKINGKEKTMEQWRALSSHELAHYIKPFEEEVLELVA